MINLVLRQLRKTWVVQVALVILFACTIVIFMFYSAYTARERSSVSRSIEGGVPSGLFLAKSAVPESVPTTWGGDVALIAIWQERTVPSNIGRIPCALFTEDPSIASLAQPGSAIVPRRLAERLDIRIDDTITLLDNNREVQLRVHEIHDGSPFGLDYDFGDRVLVFTGEAQKGTSFLYKEVARRQYPSVYYVKELHPDSQIVDSASDQSTARNLVKNNYAGVTQAQVSLVLFITLAFLTAKVLSFLDSRKTLAILKAMGLRNTEVAGVIAAEALVAPTVGVVLGVALGWVALVALERQGTGLVISGAIAVSAVVTVLPAMLVGTLVPTRFAQIATVIALLFQRSVPLYYETVDDTSKRWPQLDEYIAKGTRFLKLDTSDGVFEGIVFRQLGDTVKRGEVIAYATSWWGLKVREYVAPVDGTVVLFQPDTGFIGIGVTE